MQGVSRNARVGVVFLALIALVGCVPSPQAPVSVQPEVDAAVVATLPKDFASAVTTLDSDSGECLTLVTKLPNRYGLSASMAEDAVELLRDGAEQLDCDLVLRVVDSEGRQLDISHLAKYLPVEARDKDIVIS
ncbi:hypothetical protein [Humidisolicoccus flavus]|uniref:hypothetical protein n=1 Tax=Humidisolicoccus flavus TaxID=3111414 RepID=UPI003246F74A